MKDFTNEITALQRARIDMQIEQKTHAVTIRAKYAERIRQEIADADEASRIRFARLLKDAADAGIPQSILRSGVLRTNAWDRWLYWRDLAEIEPERVTLRNAKEEQQEAKRLADLVFEWVGNVLVVHRHPKTKDALTHPVKYPLHNAEGTYVPGTGMEEFTYLAELVGDRKAGIEIARASYAEAKRAYAEGEQTISTHPYDYINDLPEGEQADYLATEEAKFFAANPWITKIEGDN